MQERQLIRILFIEKPCVFAIYFSINMPNGIFEIKIICVANNEKINKCFNQSYKDSK
jgi:hypothetical protein